MSLSRRPWVWTRLRLAVWSLLVLCLFVFPPGVLVFYPLSKGFFPPLHVHRCERESVCLKRWTLMDVWMVQSFLLSVLRATFCSSQLFWYVCFSVEVSGEPLCSFSSPAPPCMYYISKSEVERTVSLYASLQIHHHKNYSVGFICTRRFSSQTLTCRCINEDFPTSSCTQIWLTWHCYFVWCYFCKTNRTNLFVQKSSINNVGSN